MLTGNDARGDMGTYMLLCEICGRHGRVHLAAGYYTEEFASHEGAIAVLTTDSIVRQVTPYAQSLFEALFASELHQTEAEVPPELARGITECNNLRDTHREPRDPDAIHSFVTQHMARAA